MNKNLFLTWLMLLTVLFSVSTNAQMTIGGKKEPEAFSVLELLNKGGLRLPQMTTAQRNAFAVSGNTKGEGLTIYNIDTKCVEYWNKVRWVSLCEGDSQAAISPQPCIGVPADGSGCDSTFAITDPDCPNGPFTISIASGSDYARLMDVDNVNGTFKLAFNTNETVNIHTVLVRVVSSCTSLYKEFLFSQNGVDCNSMSYAVPTVSPASPSLTLCTGGAVYLSVPANTANLDKLIWTRNGIEVARGVNHITVTQKGKYNVSMGAVGCNTNAANERNVTESGTVAPTNITILASNNGVMCGTNAVTLTASGTTGTVAWFHNGVEEKTGTTVSVSGDSNVGEWFAAVKDGSCYSKPSNTVTITKSAATGQVNVPNADVLVNGVPLNTFTTFCAGGTLNLSVANKQNGITYTWYNGNDLITVNPYIVPTTQTTMSLRMVATDNSGVQCPAEAAVIEKNVVSGSTPEQPNIVGNATICDGSTDLTIVPAVAGTYTYTWYKDGVKMAETTPTITVKTPDVTYSATVTNATGCASTLAVKKIAANVSSLPVLSWVANPTTANFAAVVTLQTAIQFGPADSYTWTANNGATVTGSGASVTINLPASGIDGTVVKVTVTAQTSCGKSVELVNNITLNNACPTPALSAQSDLTQNGIAGKGTTVKVSIANGVSPAYQWYSNTTASTTGGTAISGATTASYVYTPASAGTYYLYCIATNGCTGSPTGTSAVFTVTAAANPENLPVGTGQFIGKTCFDIAKGNDNAYSCGTLSTRLSQRTDFTLTTSQDQAAGTSVAVYTGTQVYTFIGTGSISNVQFIKIDTNNIITSLTPAASYSGSYPSGGTFKATAVYDNTLNTRAAGLTTANPLTADIYVVYNNGAANVALKLTASVKDCACCGAPTTTGGWVSFMCHNLGADVSVDPFTPSRALNGTYYQWGANVPMSGRAYTPPTASADDNAGAITGWNSSWTAAATAWNSNTEATPKKSANDPCPTGWRVPTRNEWKSIYVAANWVNVGPFTSGYNNYNSGKKVGQGLYLPAAGFRTNGGGELSNRGNYSIYWSSTQSNSSLAYDLTYDSSTVYPDHLDYISYGCSVRCVAE